MSEELHEVLNTPAVEVGDIVEGTVTEVEDKRVLLDIGYKFSGVIPIRELSALRIEHPSEVVKLGQKVTARVQKIDDEGGAVVLSRREAAAATAWEELQQKFESGAPFEVTVQDAVKGGLVVDVGVRGFIPASLVDRHFVEDLGEYKGKTIRVKVVEMDQENNKLILSRKAVLDEEHNNEVASKIESLEVGSILTGTVQRLTKFGAFVDVGGVDGLVHISELAWHHVADPAEVVQPGDKVQVRVLGVDPDAGRISLSLKEAEGNPWDEAVREFRVGEVVTGKVVRTVDFGAFVELKPGLEGLVHVSQIAWEHVERPSDVLDEGQEVQVKILAVEPDRKRISLSIKEATDQPHRAAPARPSGRRDNQQRYTQTYDDGGTGATIGDLFRDLFKK